MGYSRDIPVGGGYCTKMLMSKFKIATFGLVVGALLTVIISSIIPVIGVALATYLAPWLLLFGLGRGLLEDLKQDSPNLFSSIIGAAETFAPLKKPEVGA